jgi:CubicO group peptidase (beta-lactamase class C family)
MPASRGQLDLDALVAKYWPEPAQAGSADSCLHALSHQAGSGCKPRYPKVLTPTGI